MRAARIASEDVDLARGRREQSEREAQQRRFARAVAADDADEFARGDREREAFENAAVTATEADVREAKGFHAAAATVARNSPSSHVWRLVPAGNVSVTDTTGTPAARATASKRVVLGSTVCRL